MKRIVILTSVRQGIASLVLPALCANSKLDVVCVILANSVCVNKMRLVRRKLQKIARIGVLGAINGVRLRKWYREGAVDIEDVCRDLGVRFSEAASINSDQTRALFHDSDADLGLSLGNGYIPKSVFSIPRCGMINIHGEILPRYQGAQAVIWPIFDGIRETGFTIHQIDSRIDTGQILYQEKIPIRFRPRLRETVEGSLALTMERIPSAFSYVCENFERLREDAVSQKVGVPYTTPTYWQFLKMMRNNRALYERAE